MYHIIMIVHFVVAEKRLKVKSFVVIIRSFFWIPLVATPQCYKTYFMLNSIEPETLYNN